MVFLLPRNRDSPLLTDWIIEQRRVQSHSIIIIHIVINSRIIEYFNMFPIFKSSSEALQSTCYIIKFPCIRYRKTNHVRCGTPYSRFVVMYACALFKRTILFLFHKQHHKQFVFGSTTQIITLYTVCQASVCFTLVSGGEKLRNINRLE